MLTTEQKETVKELYDKYMALSYELMEMPGYLGHLTGVKDNPEVAEKIKQLSEAHGIWYTTAKEFENNE